MNKLWLLCIFIISFSLMAILRSRELSSLASYYKSERVLKIHHFSKVKAGLRGSDIDLFELWESILTGRSAPLAKWIKDRYKILTLNHLFTPSGFHLSAVLLPFMKFFKVPSYQIIILILMGTGLSFISGMGALKRMILIKTNQKLFGIKTGFVFALILDMLFGTFQNSTLSFTYSFLFLGLIYSGQRGISLIFLLFGAQMMIAFFQDVHLSPLLIILSPLLNFCFGLAMPLLFLLAIPMWEWQVRIAIYILRILQTLVDVSAQIVVKFPLIEVTMVTLILFICLKLPERKKRVT